nr:AAA family ATPase [Desulfobulbaceae bacterium]
MDLNKEPFSNSPDPEMIYQSNQHQSCLQKIELSIRLKRGLSVVIGDIGTGKSTVCRQLVRRINTPQDQILAHLFLDPEFSSPLEFLTTIYESFDIQSCKELQSEWKIKDAIKNFLLDQAVEKNHIPVLILDEGQKIPGFCIEILREFLNYETNNHKLIQIVIFAQNEFDTMLRQKPNFADRITTFHQLTPLSFKDTRQMIQFRLNQAQKNSGPSKKLFTPLATVAIHLISKGYPRRIVMLCSKIIIAILVKNKGRADLLDVLVCAQETPMFHKSRFITAGGVVAGLVLLISLGSVSWVSTYSIKPDGKQSITEIRPAAGSPTFSQTAELHSNLKRETASFPINNPASLPSDSAQESFDLTGQSYDQVPDFLGTVKYDNQVFLSKMIAKIYGQYRTLLLQQILEANPHITNPDNVPANTYIRFPKDTNKDTKQGFKPTNGQFWVELTIVSTLAEAYTIVKEIPDSNPPVRIIPAINEASDLTFLIVIDKYFHDISNAENSIQYMSQELQNSAIIRQV